ISNRTLLKVDRAPAGYHWTHGALDYCVRDVTRRWNNTAALTHLRFPDHLDGPICNGNDLAEKLLVNLTQHLCLYNCEGIGAFRVVELFDDALQRCVADSDS